MKEPRPPAREVILRFTVPEESEAARRALSADAAYGALWDITQWLRSEERENNAKWAPAARERVRDILENCGVDLDRDYT